MERSETDVRMDGNFDRDTEFKIKNGSNFDDDIARGEETNEDRQESSFLENEEMVHNFEVKVWDRSDQIPTETGKATEESSFAVKEEIPSESETDLEMQLENSLDEHFFNEEMRSDSFARDSSSVQDFGNQRMCLSTYKDTMEVLSCCVCDAKCDTKEKLAKHFLIHRDPSHLNSFSCSFCNYSIGQLGDLRLHLLEHDRSLGDTSQFCLPEHSCPSCDYKTKSEQDFETHLKNLHKNCIYATTCLENLKKTKQTTLFRCNMCQFMTNSLSGLKWHTKSNHSNGTKTEQEPAKPKSKKIHKCNECSYETTLLMRLKRHQETHKDRSQRKLYECPSCISKYTTNNALKQHILIKHSDPDSQSRFTCDKCSFTTFYKSMFKAHIESKHSDLALSLKTKGNVFEYKCMECPYQTSEIGNIKRHLETHKDRSERQLFECATCSRTLTTKRSLEEHIWALHTNPSVRSKLNCDDCQFTTSSRLEMRSHRKTHLEIPSEPKAKGKRTKYKCNVCSYQTDESANMKRHRDTHKDRSERQLYECTTCFRTFTAKKSLEEHTLALHINPRTKSELESAAEPKTKGKLIKCAKCSFQTSFAGSMRRHQETHKDRSERKLYECPTCSLTFTVKKTLEKHIWTLHTNSGDQS